MPTAVANYGANNLIVSSFSYTYRGDGNIATETDHNNVTTAYTYDLLGRLVSEVGGCSRYYSYDVSGNRTQAIVDTATTISYTYDSDGRLVSETKNSGSVLETTVYSYDANGSLISENDGDVTTYAYDVWGNMTSAGNASYAYNAQGLRISKTVNGSTDNFVLVGGDVWSDSENTYLRGLELISSDDYFYLYNIRGDVIQLLNYSGEVVKTYDYDAYGNELSRDLADENPFRYCGEYYDVETGLIYLRARYYDPSVGRFTSKDIHWNPYNSIYGDNPVKTLNSDDCTSYYPDELAIKQSNNQYAYCADNPLLFIDSSGHWLHIIIGTAVGALSGVIGQVVSDLVTSALSGEMKISNWQTYAGAAVGGAVGGLILSTTGSVNVANAVSGALTTGVGQTLEKLTIEGYNKSWGEIAANTAVDGTIALGLGKLPGINKITSGRNSYSAVYKSGLTKLRNNVAKTMSSKVIKKGIISSAVGGLALDLHYGVKQYAYDSTKELIKKVSEVLS